MTAAAVLAAAVAGLAAGLASIPHCAAMCGPLAAFACARRPARAALPRWQLGRMAGYALVGAVAGGAGTLVVGAAASRWAPALVSWSFAAALALLGLRLWPRPARSVQAAAPLRLRPRAPGVGERVLRAAAGSPTLFGAATALLPCGALAAAVMLAASTASPATGAVSMTAFALGSAPGLVGAGWLAGALARVRTSVLPARVLAGALLAGALFLMIRPIPALLWAVPACHCH